MVSWDEFLRLLQKAARDLRSIEPDDTPEKIVEAVRSAADALGEAVKAGTGKGDPALELLAEEAEDLYAQAVAARARAELRTEVTAGAG